MPSPKSDSNTSETLMEVGDGFAGCVRDVEVNGRWVPLTTERGWKGWQVK